MWNIFSCMGSNPRAGSSAYQLYNKVPSVQHIITQTMTNSDQYQNQNNNINNNVSYPRQTFDGSPAVRKTIQNYNQYKNQQSDYKVFANNVAKKSVNDTDGNLKQLIQTANGDVIKKVLKSNYAELVKKHREKHTKWTDPDFPPQDQSIGIINNRPVSAQWRRIPQIIKNAQFIQNKIDPTDLLRQNTSFFLSSLSVLSQNDYRIKNLFASLQMSQQGIYMARILHNGVIKQVVVDDFVPVTSQGIPMFSKPVSGNYIWLMVLEKCWAKLNGTYSAILQKLPNQVLHAFSGAPTSHDEISNDKQQQQQLWADICRKYNQGSIISCVTKPLPFVQKSGLILGHAYSILNIYQQPANLLKLRNPISNRQWTGRASELDTQFWSRVSPADKQIMGFKQANDGIFYILWQDFVNYFSYVDTCSINDNANYISNQVQISSKRGQVFQLTVENQGKIHIGLTQPEIDHRDAKNQSKGYSRATLIVSRYQQQSQGHNYKYVGSASSRKSAQLYIQLPNLPKGKYIIFAKIDWQSQSSSKACVSIYSQPKVILKKSKQSNHKNFLFSTFLDHSRRNPNKNIIKDYPQQWICSQILLKQCGYGYIVVHLSQKSKTKLDFSSKRLVLKKPYKNKGISRIMVSPGEEMIVLFRVKSQNYPKNITVPAVKIYNLV